MEKKKSRPPDWFSVSPLGTQETSFHLKPIFHWKWGSVPNANEIYTKNMKYTTPAFCVGTQRNLYSTGWRRGLASGLTQILGLASGNANFHILDTNMLVSVSEIKGAPCTRRAHFHGRVHDFRRCAPGVCTFFLAIYY